MKLTPLDIRHQEFRRVMRGYSEEQVDVFLDEVADEFETLFQDSIELRERIQLLEAQIAGYEKLKETLNNTLVSAQQLADSTRENANKEGELILRDAQIKARGIVGEADSEKQRVQRSLIQLRQVEEDFRFKFRSLLEAHINLLAEDGASDERRRFRGIVTDVESQLKPSTTDGSSSSPPAGPSSDVSTEAAVASSEAAAVRLGPSEFESAMSTPRKAAAGSDEQVVETVSDEPDFSGYLARLPDSEADAEALGGHVSLDETPPDEVVGDEVAGDEASADEVAGDDAKSSTVRRFLFGKRDKPESEGLFEQKDRDFEW